ncbi:hypothetical protein FRC14_002996 [Serendipita sp. 396]|nr:hypothetical protein FRC14_002996 [Serendipita sp. 396]KAG8784302.1 hypothetical protein FRC15_003515 [Serendipita sp. 397]KAG8799795.1 hypothetical protein FRC16_004354 [Serendipita sp. 398]KAG8840152.1 hypothetical protein FRB91_006474 [Serendipita sp. 411]
MPGALNFLFKTFSPGGGLHKKLIAGSVQDRDSVVASAKQVDALDIQRIIPLHGDVIETDAHQKWKVAYQGLL